MSPVKKPPWKTIHLPCAMSALAEIMVHGQPRNYAKMALFYALLSVSSFHMSCVNQKSDERAQHWKSKGAEHRKTAEIYLRLALDENIPKEARGKYKEVLMSILSMVTIGVSVIKVPAEAFLTACVSRYSVAICKTVMVISHAASL